MGFILKYPKLIGAAIMLAVIVSVGVHYKLVIGERNDLRADKIELEGELAKAERNAEVLKEDLRLAAAATAEAAAERDMQILALDDLKRGRESDPVARSWGKQALPIGEIERLCAALPEMAGCAQ